MQLWLMNMIKGLTIVEKPFETYLVVRDVDGDRELTAADCRELMEAAKRIEALEAALRQIATLEDLPSSLSVARSIARGAALAPEPEK